MKKLFGFIALALLAGCGGGGGGGGGTPLKATLIGRVIWIETGSGPNPAATVRAGTASTLADVLDGYFEFETETGVTSATITFVPNIGKPVVRTFTFAGATGTVELGDLYIGPQVVTLKGTAVDVSTNVPIAGATVTIAGRKATTTASGAFSVADVAYSSANPAVFLGLEGSVAAPSFFTRQFNPPTLATAGIVQVGTIGLTPVGSIDPPPPPFDVQGNVTPANLGAGATIVAKLGTVVLRRTMADGAGRFTLWLPAGTYTIQATKGAKSGQTTVTVSNPNVIKNINVAF